MFGKKKIKKTISSAKHIERRKKQKRLRQILGGFFVVVIIVGLSYWSRHPSVVVAEVSVEGTQYVDKVMVEANVLEEIKGYHLFLFPKTNKLLIPRQNIKRALHSKYLALESVDTDIQGSVLRVIVEEFEPKALWCNDNFPTYFIEEVEHSLSEEATSTEPVVEEEVVAEEKCYMVNNAGLVYMEEPVGYEGELLKLHNILDSDPVGETYLSTVFFKTLEEFNTVLSEDLDINVTEVYSEDQNTFVFVTVEGPRILVDATDDFTLVADNLATVMEQQAINEAQFSNIEYIDMRFGNRVFYKLK